VAVHWDFALAATEVGLQTTDTELTVEEGAVGACTFNEAEPDLAGFWVLLAVMATVAADEGAVNRPLVVMVPALADHLTAEL
jgi:hypothetical protein